MEKIYAALAAAKKEVDAIGKNRTNEVQKYKFRGIDEAMDAFSPLLASHGLTVVCDRIEHLTNDGVVSKQGGAGYRVVNNYSFKIYAEDGSFIQGQADGEAIDYGDKCTTKAQSVALREFLFKTFMVPFHTVDDIEEASHDLNAPQSHSTAPRSDDKPVHATTVAKSAYKPDLAKAEYTGTHECTKCHEEVIGPDIFEGKYGKCFRCPHCDGFSKPNPKKITTLKTPSDIHKAAEKIFENQPKIEDVPFN